MHAFLGDIASGARTLLLDGAIGIGKTTLWREGVAAAEQRGQRVLACRPVEAEIALPFTALGDLLERRRERDAERATRETPFWRQLQERVARSSSRGTELAASRSAGDVSTNAGPARQSAFNRRFRVLSPWTKPLAEAARPKGGLQVSCGTADRTPGDQVS